MSLEAIKTIGEAEEQAKKIKADAAADAKKAINAAEAEGIASVEAVVKKAEDELREINKTADEKANKDVERIAIDTEAKKTEMRQHAESMLDKAASLIVERIVKS